MTRPAAARRGQRLEPPGPPVIVRARRLVTVTGVSGGLGASVLAAAVAVRAAAAGLRVAAVDLDPLGGGLDVTFGAEQSPGLRWPDLLTLEGAADGAALRASLPEPDGVGLLSHTREGDQPDGREMVAHVVEALRADGDLVVVDLPLGVPAATSVLATADTAVLLAGVQLRHLAALAVAATVVRSAAHGRPTSDAGRGADYRGPLSARADLVVCLRDERGAADVTGFVGEELDLPVLGVLGDDRGLRADLVHGLAPGTRRGPLTSLADLVLGRVMLGQGEGAA
ncbi:MAG: hypothetical protein ABI083_02845 [Lapillicoccus sp.]